ncbi:MAG: YkgJ family cysteine cluster protein [Prevotellaceae bacterium]|jgi:Fe-S-cluster containining protein|nr:YkgJ family cysteine cluster protein [Prevotellaceae bacterium]
MAGKDLSLTNLPTLAKKSEPAFRQFFRKNKKKIENADELVFYLHKQAFKETDCLQCANCCRTLGPRITDRDIDQIAKALRIRPSKVIENYLRMDEDNDYVFQSMPCPFLMNDNYCSIYENRPKACREYPHTDRRRFYQIYGLTVKNAYTCPVAYSVLKNLQKELK